MRYHARELKPVRRAGRVAAHNPEKAASYESRLGKDLLETIRVAKESRIVPEFHTVRIIKDWAAFLSRPRIKD